jgi:hypothetical protein
MLSVDAASSLSHLSTQEMVVGKANPDEETLRIIVENAFAGLM